MKSRVAKRKGGLAAVPNRKRRQPARRRRNQAGVVGTIRREMLGHALFSPDCNFQLPTGGTNNVLHIQHKQVAIIKPAVTGAEGGSVRFAIVPSPMGAIAVDQAASVSGRCAQFRTGSTGDNAVAAIAWRQVKPGTPHTWGAIMTPGATAPAYSNTIGAGQANRYPVIPYEEWVNGGAPWKPISAGGQGSNFQPAAYRVTRQIWRLSYTGAALYAQGQIGVCQQYVQTEKTLPSAGNWAAEGLQSDNNVFAPVTCDLEVLTAGVVPTTFADIAVAPHAKTWAVQPNTSIGGVKFPQSTDFKAWREMTVPVVSTGTAIGTTTGYEAQPLFAQLVKASTNDNGSEAWVAGPAPGMGALPVTYVAAENLTTASDVGGQAGFLLEVYTDVEYQVMPTSAVRRFTQPPVSENAAALKVVSEVAKQSPPAVEAPTTGGVGAALGNALGWYANTMKSIVGTVWGTGGQVLQDIGLFPKFGKTMQSLNGVLQGTSRLAITG